MYLPAPHFQHRPIIYDPHTLLHGYDGRVFQHWHILCPISQSSNMSNITCSDYQEIFWPISETKLQIQAFHSIPQHAKIIVNFLCSSQKELYIDYIISQSHIILSLLARPFIIRLPFLKSFPIILHDSRQASFLFFQYWKKIPPCISILLDMDHVQDMETLLSVVQFFENLHILSIKEGNTSPKEQAALFIQVNPLFSIFTIKDTLQFFSINTALVNRFQIIMNLLSVTAWYSIKDNDEEFDYQKTIFHKFIQQSIGTMYTTRAAIEAVLQYVVFSWFIDELSPYYMNSVLSLIAQCATKLCINLWSICADLDAYHTKRQQANNIDKLDEIDKITMRAIVLSLEIKRSEFYALEKMINSLLLQLDVFSQSSCYMHKKQSVQEAVSFAQLIILQVRTIVHTHTSFFRLTY